MLTNSFMEYSQRGQAGRMCRASGKTKQGRGQFVPHLKRRIRHFNSSFKFYKRKNNTPVLKTNKPNLIEIISPEVF